MRVLDLFSGIGGFSIGLERAGMETVAFCEYDEKCRQVLTKHWPDVPQYTDIRTLTGAQLEADGITDIGLICGGYPCQPFSLAGKRSGEKDDRHLWPEAFRLVKEIRPDWCIFENVAGHITMGLDDVLADLESENYTWQPFVIPACAIDAKHRRDRVWIVAHNDSDRRWLQQELANREDKANLDDNGEEKSLANSQSERRREERGDRERSAERITSGGSISNAISQRGKERLARPAECEERDTRKPDYDNSTRFGQENWSGMDFWTAEPNVGRVANGVPGRVDRLKQLGNAVVPQIPEIIGRAIMAIQ